MIIDLTPPAFRDKLLCITTTRQAGDLRTLANRAEICRGLNIPPESLACGQQVHKNHIVLITRSNYHLRGGNYGKAIPKTDALVTSLVNVPLAVFTADCLPIFIWCPAPSFFPSPLGGEGRVRGMVGIVHAGRQGTQLKILEKSLKFIFRLSGVKPHSLLLIFGPCICRKCYGVDLRAENLNQALQAGIPKKNIYQSNLCTVCHPELFFSYRKTHTPRRMMNVVMMKK